MRADEIVRFETVEKTHAARRGAVVAVSGVSFALSVGRVFGIVGQSGSGKSTLANLLVREETPSAGRILFDGVDIAAISAENRQSSWMDLRKRWSQDCH